MRRANHRTRRADSDPTRASPYGPAAVTKRRNEEAECTTEPDRFAPNHSKKPLAFWGGVHVRMYAAPTIESTR